MEESEAIHRLKSGDINGLAVLVATYQTEAVRTANMIVRNPAQAEDIVQDVFLRVYERIASFDDNRDFRPWFMRIVVNEALRKAPQEREISLETSTGNGDLTLGDTLPADQPLPPEIFERQEIRAILWECLGELPPSYRSIITMRYYLDFSEQEMAETLDCPAGTIKWRLHEARKQLRLSLIPHLNPMQHI